MNSNRRSIEELVTRYLFHPELRDLYVEGDRDVGLFRWFLGTQSSNAAVVYSIETVDVPASKVSTFELDAEGNKMRVIALSLELDRLLPPDCRVAFCCVDKDFQDYDKIAIENRYLLFTDFSCLECYALSEGPLLRFCQMYLGMKVSPDDVTDLVSILSLVFFVRYAKRKHAPNLHWFNDFTEFCKLDSDRNVTIDRQAYITRVVQTAHRKVTAEQVQTVIENLAGACADKRQAIHGHDLVQLISWLAQKRGLRRELSNAASLHRALLTSMADATQLYDHNLFKIVGFWAITS